jgi:hypothetical protein
MVFSVIGENQPNIIEDARMGQVEITSNSPIFISTEALAR